MSLDTGCAYHDGAFIYHASGRLVDAAQLPLAGRGMCVQLGPFRSATQPVTARVSTSENGRFEQEMMTGLAWGYTSLFGIIPLGSTHPNPPVLEKVYVAIERSRGDWCYLELPVTRAQQSEPGAVELGDVTVRP
jgi:hypothetical protein